VGDVVRRDYAGTGRGLLRGAGDQRRRGETWQETLVADPDGPGPLRAFDPNIWTAPNGMLIWFWAQTVGLHGGRSKVWTVKISNPEQARPKYEVEIA